MNIGCCSHQDIVMATALHSLKYFATKNSFEAKSVLSNREFKKLRRLWQRKRHFKMTLCVRLSALQLFNRLVTLYKISELHLLLLGTKGFHANAKNKIFTAAGLALSSEPQKRNYHVVVWQTTTKNFTKKSAPLAARLFSLIQPIKSLICGVVFVISYSLISETKLRAKYTHARIGEHFRGSFRVAYPPRLARACFFHLFCLL